MPGELREAGCAVLLELGPGIDLTRMARDRLPGVVIRSIAKLRSLDCAVAWVTRPLRVEVMAALQTTGARRL